MIIDSILVATRKQIKMKMNNILDVDVEREGGR
jgi:hypothetical protein